MKRLYLFTLIYFLLFRIVAPGVFYILFGYVDTVETRPIYYLFLAAGYMALPIIISIVIIMLLPIGRGKVKSETGASMSFFYFCVLFSLFKQYQMGSYENALTGVMNGTWIAYASLFMDPQVLLIIYLMTKKQHYNLYMILFAFLIVTIAMSSRQGVLTIVVLLFAMCISTDKFKMYKKQIIFMVLCCVIFAVPIYSYSTMQRSSSAGSGRQLIRNIVMRCSDLEVTSLALYQRDAGIWKGDIFEEKYSLENQTKLVIDAMLPGSIWEDDVTPNQYYRSIFMGMDVEAAKVNYTSVNLTLPVYFHLKYPFVLSTALSVAIIVLFYIICAMFKRNLFFIVSAYMILFEILMFFDWVQIFRQIEGVAFTCFFYYLVKRFSACVKIPKIKSKIWHIKIG